MTARSVDILILTTPDCSWCDLAKDIAERLSERWPLEVTTLDLSSPSGQLLASESGAPFPPVIFIDGQFFCYGRPSEKRLRRALEQRSHVPLA